MSPARRLAFGVAALPVALRDGCREAVLRHQDGDGGFRGRAGAADDWYTAFALRVLTLTGAADAAWQRSAAWLRARSASPATAADAACRVQAAWLCAMQGMPVPLPVARLLPVLRSADGASAAFLASDALALLGHAAGFPVAVRNPDGGCPERPGAPSQTNATAAALATGLADPQVAIAWISALQAGDGGMRAHADAPAGDLLSTFVAAWALGRRLDALRLGDLARFVQSCRTADGFGACPGDTASDPEFTFYGLAVLGLLAAQAGRRGTLPRAAAWRGPRCLLLANPATRCLGWRLLGGG